MNWYPWHDLRFVAFQWLARSGSAPLQTTLTAGFCVFVIGCCSPGHPLEGVDFPAQSQPSRPSSWMTDVEKLAELPYVVVDLISGYSTPASRPPDGLLLAVWRDGTVLRAASQAEVGKAYLYGGLSRHQLALLRQAVQGDVLTWPGEGHDEVYADIPVEQLHVYTDARHIIRSRPVTFDLGFPIMLVKHIVFKSELLHARCIDRQWTWRDYPPAWDIRGSANRVTEQGRSAGTKPAPAVR